MNFSRVCLSTIALIALTACGQNYTANTGHLKSNGAQDSIIEDTRPPPTDLVGWTNNSVIERLGEPDIARFEGGILYWRYSTTHCLLDIYLSADAQSGDLAVEHFAIRPRSPLMPANVCPMPPSGKRLDPDIRSH